MLWIVLWLVWENIKSFGKIFPIKSFVVAAGVMMTWRMSPWSCPLRGNPLVLILLRVGTIKNHNLNIVILLLNHICIYFSSPCGIQLRRRGEILTMVDYEH